MTMEILTTTPFGSRPVTRAHLRAAELARAPAPLPRADKWGLFRELCAARAAFGLSDRDLTVLAALLSFHPGGDLAAEGGLIVFPSNAALSERAHGMAESTLRRHLAALVGAGVICRHDSPNGKRYAARGEGGTIARAFGFDLRPLLVRAPEITAAALAAREAAERLRRLREAVSLLKRDAFKLLAYGAGIRPGAACAALEARLLDLHRRSRRKADADALRSLRDELRDLLGDIAGWIETETGSRTEKMDGSDADSGRQLQSSKRDSICLEPCREAGRAAGGAPRSDPALPFALVLKACPDVVEYFPDDLGGWGDLCRAADRLRGMLGVSVDAWQEAVAVMGAPTAAVVLVCILQRVAHIRSPGGYLRSLTEKAGVGAFSVGPMVMALLNAGAKVDSCQLSSDGKDRAATPARAGGVRPFGHRPLSAR
jgi:replication initiation protein RepC